MNKETRILTQDDPRLRRHNQTFAPRLVVAGIAAGAIGAIFTIMLQVSFAALLFSGPLTTEMGRGIGLLLWGAAVLNLVIAFRSSQPGVVSTPQEAPVAVLALATAVIAAQLTSAPAEVRFATATAVMLITSVLTAVVCWTISWFRLGSFIRILPYPVLGGFLAGTGWLLLNGGVSVIVGSSLNASVFQLPILTRWLPGLFFAVTLLVTLRYVRQVLVLPVFVVIATALFYAYLWLAGIPIATATSYGWLLGPFPAGTLWQPLTPSLLSSIDWPVVLSQSDKIVTAIVMGIIGLLLNTSGLELVVRQDIDQDREVRVAGLANLVASLGGSPPGYHALALTALAFRMGGQTRLAGVFVAMSCGVALAFGATLLGTIPRVVVGGMLIYLGLAFLVEWLYDAWFQLPRLDYALIVLILVTIATVGLLPGVVLGLAVAVLVFTVNYSRVSAVRYTISGVYLQSRMQYTREQQMLLQANGEQTMILKLQGFLFFVTANDLVERVRQRVRATNLPALRFVVLDFRQVTGVDSTAIRSLIRLQRLAQIEQICLVVASLPDSTRASLARVGFPEPDTTVTFVPDLDRGMEWCEHALLRDLEADQVRSTPLYDQLQSLVPEADYLDTMLTYFEHYPVTPGTFLVHRGDPADEFYFVESGQVSAQIVAGDGQIVRLETMGGGRIVGELGFYRNSTRTADVVVDEPGVVYRLSRDALRRMEYEAPQAAATLHEIINQLLAERVVHLMTTVEALQR